MRLADYLQKTGESQAAFGARLGITQSAVAQLCAGGRIKPERVLEAAAATGWDVTPHDWRPDLYPHPDDGMPKPGNLPGVEPEGAAIVHARAA